MKDLKSSHFILGKDQTGFGFKASSHIGRFAKTARASDHVPWATRKTHFGLGIDNENKTSDYAMRYQKANSNPNANNTKDMIANKTKIEADSTQITNPVAKI